MFEKPDNPSFSGDVICMGLLTEAERHRLIIQHMELVEPIAADFRGRKGIPYEDLVAAGREGLVKAARNFDPEQGRFPNFAGFRIRGQINDFIDAWQHLIPMGDADEIERNFHEWDIWGSAAPYEKWTNLPVTPEELIIAFDELSEQKAAMMVAWQFLPKMERSVIHARYFRDPPQTLNSVAREFKMPYATTVDFINRTLRRLAEEIEGQIARGRHPTRNAAGGPIG
jgi:RNA polymerase sigma factor (sigma-70 family)